MEKFFTNKYNVFIISLICMALWGSAFPVVKIGYEMLHIETGNIFGKIYFAGLRFFIASIMVYSMYRLLNRKGFSMKKDYIGPIIVLGLLQTSLQYFFFYIGIANTSGIKSAILQSGSTFFTVIAAHFIYRDDRLNVGKLTSLILGFSGVIIVNLGKNFDLGFRFIGEGFLILAGLLSATATLYAKGVSNRMENISPFLLSGGQMFSGSLLLLLVGRIGMSGASLNFTLSSFFLLVYAAFISAAAFTLWYMIIRYNPAGKVSIYRLFIPIFGSLFSVLLISGESFTMNLALGLLLVVLGIGILNMEARIKDN